MGNHVNATTIEFWELWSPFVLILSILAAVVYVRTVRSIEAGEGQVETKKKVYFFVALGFFFLIKGTPLAFYARNYLFSLHMLQQSMLYFLIAPMLLLSLPAQLYARWQRSKRITAILRVVTHPVVAIFLFSSLFSLYHYPSLFNQVSHPSLHSLIHAILFIAALQVWWSLIAPMPELNYLSPLKKIFAIVASGVLLLPICIMVVFSSTPMYYPYYDAPQLFWFLSTRDDQQLGGVAMKLFQEISLFVALAQTFYQWYTKHKQADMVDPDYMPSTER